MNQKSRRSISLLSGQEKLGCNILATIDTEPQRFESRKPFVVRFEMSVCVCVPLGRWVDGHVLLQRDRSRQGNTLQRCVSVCVRTYVCMC